jgi:hypothetical protein
MSGDRANDFKMTTKRFTRIPRLALARTAISN